MNKAGVYVHLPFCFRRCHYCSFKSQAVGSLSSSQRDELFTEYLAAVEKEAALWQLPFAPATLYLGGGTPSLLQHKLAPFIERLRRRFALPRTAEITVEANPGTVNQEILASLATAGVNRLSLGLQSASDELLKACGRLHSWEDFLQTWRAAREVGFKNISLDLIYGLPGQTLASWSQTLSAALDLAPEHISLYALSVEEGCGWTVLPEAAFPAEEEVAEDYQLACEVLERRNYVHYELSNWSKTGRESRHNLLYWTGGEYLGLGAAAHSSLGNARVWNCWPVSDYLQRIACEDRTLTYSWALPAACGKWAATAGGERLNAAAKRAETLILALRLMAGVDRREFRAQYGWPAKWDRAVDSLVGSGLLAKDPLRLTARGFLLANQVFLRFLDD